MADAAGGFEHAPAFETEPPGGLIHRADDRGRGVMGVQGGGAGGTVFFVRKNSRKLDLFLAPVGVVHVEYLWQPAPADVFDQHRFFFLGRGPFLGVELSQRFDCRDVSLKFLLGSAFAQPVGFGNSIVVEIPRRFFLMTLGYSSDGSRMYFPRTISHA